MACSASLRVRLTCASSSATRARAAAASASASRTLAWPWRSSWRCGAGSSRTSGCPCDRVAAADQHLGHHRGDLGPDLHLVLRRAPRR